jgi:soluble P-type ATPase
MQFGDLSNEMGKAVVINADLIGYLRKTRFGLKRNFALHKGAKSVLQNLFKADINVYIVCSGDLLDYYAKVEQDFDFYFIPYTRVYRVADGADLSMIVNDEHVMRYYYKEESPFQPLMSLQKFRKVTSIEESYRELGNV